MSENLRNWAGNITFGARHLHRPSSVEQLQDLVARTPLIRALGTGHSFNPLADSPGELVSVAGLPQTFELDEERRTVTVAAGLRYGEVASRLHERGFALHNLASLPHISVAGACATGTHGSGDHNGALPTAVVGLEMVTADGELVSVRRDRDGDFPGAVVALGLLGVVTSLTLRVSPTFQVRQYVDEDLPLAALNTRFDDVFASAYSVSLFTDWTQPRFNQVWRKELHEEAAGGTGGSSAGDGLGVGSSLPGTTPADGPRHPVPGMSPVNCTEQLGVPGPWHARLPHFRLDFTPSSGTELQSEYLVPRDRAVSALHAVDGIRERIAPVLQISEIRSIAADDLWLSPSYGRDTIGIHFTWIEDTAAVMPVVGAVEGVLAPVGARPHWGKVFSTRPEVVRGLYDRWADFAALAQRYDPAGKFRNEMVDRFFPAG